jgi:hypothetical protein
MVKLNSRITAEIDSLVEAGTLFNHIVSTSQNGVNSNQLADITTWVTRLGQLIRNLYGENSQHFDSYARALETNSFYVLHSGYHEHFSQMVGVANAIKHDVSNGLLFDIKSLAQAEVFADFLEMGEHLLREGYKDAAAVIIGGVLEDALRKLSERASLPVTGTSGKPLTIDPLNTELAKAEVYSKLTQKQITSWAHIRNKAAHGEYAEYNKEQVEMMLLFVQNFAGEHLA